AKEREKKICTFSPLLTAMSKTSRSRSTAERSIGDTALREAKQRMVQARKEGQLLKDLEGQNFTFQPHLFTRGDPLAPDTASKLRLANELETYTERIK
ncbi:unnamed protein product, partial [Choristocarpus tenellus]